MCGECDSVEKWFEVRSGAWLPPIYDAENVERVITIEYIGYGDTSDGQNLWDVFVRAETPDGTREWVLGRQGDTKTFRATKAQVRMNGGLGGPSRWGIRYKIERV